MSNKNYITAEIETFKTWSIQHVLLIYTDGRRVLVVDRSDKKATDFAFNYLDTNHFTINSFVKTDSQLLISF